MGNRCDFMQNCPGYSDDIIPAQPISNYFTDQRYLVTIQICNKLVSFMTAKSSACVSSIFDATQFGIIDTSKIDVMF